jgi:hypothetical protein
MIYESSDVTPETNDVIVLLTTIYFVRVINTVKETITCAKLGYIFTVVTLISSTNKTDRHDITEILFKVAFNTIKTKSNQYWNQV